MSSSGAKLVKQLNEKWSLRQWEYDGAALELHGPGVVMELKNGEVELGVEYSNYDCWSASKTEMTTATVPVTVLLELLGVTVT